MTKYRTFAGGRNGGVFTCLSCGRRTRHTQDQSNDEICEDCYELAGLENGVADGRPPSDYLAEARERYQRIVCRAVITTSGPRSVTPSKRRLVPEYPDGRGLLPHQFRDQCRGG